MSKEDSGVIDLLAIHNKAKAEAAAASIVPPPMSAPPPAFTMDLCSTPDVGRLSEIDELAFADKGKKKKIGILVGAAAGCIGLIAVLASLAGSSEAEATKAAGRPREAKTEVAPPAAAATSIPAAIPAPAPVETVAASTPAPPSTGTPVRAAAPSRATKSAPRAPTKRPTGGPKLTKVQSSGV